MKKHIISALLGLTITSSVFSAPVASFPKYMYSEGGCSEVYFKKARKMNKIVGFGAGAVGIIGSTFMPLSAVFLLGGLGAAGETGYTYVEERENLDKKKMAPRVRYPIARQYFDINNSLELNKIIKNQGDSEIAEFIPLYIDSLFMIDEAKDQYKECKSLAKLEGISRREIKDVEKDIMKFLLAIEEQSEQRNLTPIEKAKKDLANCLLEIEVDGSYPVADLLLLRNELKETGLLTWRFKSAVRLYGYVLKKARQQNKTLSSSNFFKILDDLDQEGSICKNIKRPLNRRNLAKEVLLQIEQ